MNIKQPNRPDGTESYLDNHYGRTDIEIVMNLLEQGGAPPFGSGKGVSKTVSVAFIEYAELVSERIENPFAKRMLQNGVEVWRSRLK